MAKHEFQTEIGKLLKLIIHSLYSNKEIFIRELISNSSDAIDKLRYKTLSDDNFKNITFEPKIKISLDSKLKVITFSDNGIGMSEAELVKNLGTIAKSGTSEFLATLENKKDSNLIGQFGVGFYSAFMVANKIEVLSKPTNSNEAYLWSSNGEDSFEIEKSNWDVPYVSGTFVKVYLKDEETTFTSNYEVERIIKKYSDHIAYPIFIEFEQEKYDSDGKVLDEKETVSRQSNVASALWTRSKSELGEQEYKDFYKNTFSDYEEPLIYSHNKNEGSIEYTTLFYIPKKAPFDMYANNYKHQVKLYIKRVFITDDDKNLLPRWLRFIKGIIDSEDLPLNVSREILQENNTLSKIKSQSVKKILSMIKDLQKDKEKFNIFAKEFNKTIKEGFFDEFGSHKEDLVEIIRFKSTKSDEFVSLADYVSRMVPEQKAIYYVSGSSEKVLKNSPLLEKYIKDGVEVLICADEIDEICIPSIEKYKDYELKSIAKLGTDLEDDKKPQETQESEAVINKIKQALGDKIKDVKISSRLVSSPSCIVTDDSDMTFAMQNIMKMMGNGDLPPIKPILEINMDSKIVKSIPTLDDEKTKDLSMILLDQALLNEGLPISDSAEFVKRINKFLELL